MKHFVLLTFILLTLVGCSADNDQPNYSYEVNPIDSYTIPTEFKLGETYAITLKFTRPTECHLYQGIYYSKNLNVRTIAIKTVVDKNQACVQNEPMQSEVTFDFFVTNTGSYIFKFYKGKDANDVSIFEEVEVPVTN
jgi:hypothetical protein